MTAPGFKKMMMKILKTGLLSVAPGRGRMATEETLETQETVALSVQESIAENTQGSCSVNAVARRLDLPSSTVHTIVRKMRRYYPYTIKCFQELKSTLTGEKTHLLNL